MERTKIKELLRALLQRASVFDSFSLKCVAILCMAADHTGRILLSLIHISEPTRH